MKLILYMTITANGYIAKVDGTTPWNTDSWSSYHKTVKQYPAIIIGKNTFQIMKEYNDFDKIGNPFTIVISNSLNEKSENILSVKTIKEGIEVLKVKDFKEVLISGGSKLNSSFLKENLIDEIILDVDSKIFGKGMPLFDHIDHDIKLNLITVKKTSSKLYQVNYSVDRNAEEVSSEETTQVFT